MNDTSALADDPEMAAAVRASGAAVVSDAPAGVAGDDAGGAALRRAVR